jgi:hypothetical protein
MPLQRGRKSMLLDSLFAAIRVPVEVLGGSKVESILFIL